MRKITWRRQSLKVNSIFSGSRVVLMELELWSGVRHVGHKMREFCIYCYDVRIKLEAIDGEESSVL